MKTTSEQVSAPNPSTPEATPEATPRPWRYQEESDAYTHIIRGPNNRIVAQLSQDTTGISEADARLIVRAVNSYDDMLAALKAICAEINDIDSEEWTHAEKRMLARAQAAIAKVVAQ